MAADSLPGISGFSLILRRVILARKASVVSEYKLTIAASVPLEIAATLEASLLSKHVALFRRGKRSEHGLAVVAKSRLSSHGIAPKSVMVKKRQLSVWQCGSMAVAK